MQSFLISNFITFWIEVYCICLHEKGRVWPNVEKPFLLISKAQNLNCPQFSWRSQLLGLGANTRSQKDEQTRSPRTEFFCKRRLKSSPKCHVTIIHALDEVWYHFDPDMGWNCSTRICWCKPAYLYYSHDYLWNAACWTILEVSTNEWINGRKCLRLFFSNI
jgi:hypothetical protein